MTEEEPKPEFKLKNNDPVAERLFGHVHEFPKKIKKPRVDNDALHYRLAKFAETLPQAKYKTTEFYESDDEIVLDFLAKLGVNPISVHKATIHIENNKPLRLEIEQYAVKSESIGSNE